jgi:very-short-patch-repair endonuclease
MEELLAIATDQHGLFTGAQWKAAGLSRRSLTYKKASGLVHEIHPGVFALAGAPASFEQLVLAAGQRPTESELEDDFLNLVIRRYNLPLPVRQYPVGRRRIDFAYPELVLGVEIESVRAHAAREDVHRNASKANELLEWWILRFAFDDVHRWPEETAELLDRTITRRRQAA